MSCDRVEGGFTTIDNLREQVQRDCSALRRGEGDSARSGSYAGGMYNRPVVHGIYEYGDNDRYFPELPHDNTVRPAAAFAALATPGRGYRLEGWFESMMNANNFERGVFFALRSQVLKSEPEGRKERVRQPPLFGKSTAKPQLAEV